MDFYVCILSSSHHSDQETELIQHLRKLPHSHSLPKLLSFLGPSFLQNCRHSHCCNLFNLFLSVLQLNVIKICCFGAWLHQLSNTSQRYIHEVTCSCTVSIIVFHCMNILQFSYPVFPPDGLLGCFQFLAIRNKALRIFLCMSFWGHITRSKSFGSQGRCMIT